MILMLKVDLDLVHRLRTRLLRILSFVPLADPSFPFLETGYSRIIAQSVTFQFIAKVGRLALAAVLLTYFNDFTL